MSDSAPSSELRWHPLLQQWVAVAAERQGRPQLPQDWCPFCPGSGRVPDHYDVYLYSNDFPAFSLDNPPFVPQAELFGVTGARGVCDVVLYSPDHNLLPSQLTVEQWAKVIELWTRRTVELFANADIQYVSVFENTGVAIGVTMPHPHGQIYGFPMPLMMLVRQAPAKGEHPYFHFHVEFLPIQRSPTKLKYLAAVESGNGTFLNDTRAEEQAALMRACLTSRV